MQYIRGTNLRQHLHVVEVSVVKLLPVTPGEVVWTASLWTRCVDLLSQSWPLPGQHKQLGHHRQDQIPQLPKLWGEKNSCLYCHCAEHLDWLWKSDRSQIVTLMLLRSPAAYLYEWISVFILLSHQSQSVSTAEETLLSPHPVSRVQGARLDDHPGGM